MVMELETVLPRGNPHFPHEVIGLVEGTDTIFINVSAGLFTLDLKSRKLKKIGKREDCYWIKPYMSFYTPGISLCAFFKKKKTMCTYLICGFVKLEGRKFIRTKLVISLRGHLL
jgi:hypothetical protein